MEPIMDLDQWTFSSDNRDLVMRKSAAHRLDVALLL
jgi:hypothetical protein